MQAGIFFLFLVGLGSIWLARFFLKWSKELTQEMKVATTPIPTPDEIAFGLQEEWGREASVGEVAAVQQMLHNRKNEAMLNTGISLGAVYLLSQSARRF